MKRHLKKIIMTPKLAISIALVVVLIVGVASTVAYNKKQAERFSKINTLTSATLSANKNSSQNLTLAFLIGGKIKNVSVKIGDKVKAGDILASLNDESAMGAVNQAKGAYNIAEANYQKIINGATGTAVDVAKATVNTAEVNLKEINKQQEILVNNAYRNLLNSSLEVQTVSDTDAYDGPIVSGTYKCKEEGSYDLETYGSAGGVSVNYSGLEKGILFLTDIPRPLGNCGLFLSFDKTKILQAGLEFNIQIPNTNAANYNANYNAYQLALQTKEQAIAGAQATLDQANASLNSVVANARPEDVAVALAQVESTKGALQIAESSYNNTVIVAPVDGTITNVAITAGQIATPNTPAIELLSQ